jgi:FMN phosphatase YigB (HAD superfamily)
VNVDAVVLDLDDTLLDTAGLLVPMADRRALQAMIAAGLPVDLDTASATLREVRAAGIELLFHEIARRHGGTPECADAGTDAFFRFDVPPIALEPAVEKALHALHAAYPLALLTAGHEPTQRAKIARLDIEPFFIECLYVEIGAPGGKAPALRALCDRRGWRPECVVFAGDRPSSDIRAANAVGCRGVLVRAEGGEFAASEPSGPDEEPWATIPSVTALPALLSR